MLRRATRPRFMSAGSGVPGSGRYYAASATTHVRKPSLTASHPPPGLLDRPAATA